MFRIFLITISFLGVFIVLFNLSLAQGSTIPMCTSPNNLLILPGTWQPNRILMTDNNAGVLRLADIYFFDNIINQGPILIASGTWFNLNRGLILSGPSGNNFSVAGALYFRDLNKVKNKSYNEFSISMTSTTNDLIFLYKDALNNNRTNRVMTISRDGNLIISNIFALNNLSIGTTTMVDKLYLYSTGSQYINLDSNNGGNLKIGTLFNPAEAVMRFKEVFKVFYSNNNNPILTITNSKIGINTTIPNKTLDVLGDIQASGNISANSFCLGNNCINSWPSGGGGGIGGNGTQNYIPKWSGPTSLTNSVLREITYPRNNTSLQGIENYRGGGFIAKEFCFRTDAGDLSCINAWPNRPAVAHFYRYIIGHEYWQQDLFNRMITSAEISVTNTDPYIRPTSPNYDYNLGKGYPYLRLHDIIARIGVDPNNPYATKWFILGYAYRQPYTNRLTAVFIEEGDNLNPWKRYTKTPTSSNGLNPNNSNDVLVYCHYQANNGAIYVSKDQNECASIRDGQIPGYSIISYTYAESQANIKGYVSLDIRLEPAWQRTVCTKRDYLNSMSVASWGDPGVINLRVNGYRYPNLDNDPCVDLRNNRRPNLHSLIMGRFRVNPYPTSSTTDPSYISPTPISNFLNHSSANFTVVIKSLGIVELLNY